MTHCAKCGAELIGTRKFCTACGAPAGDPRSPAASTGMSPAAPASSPGRSGPSIQYAPSGPVSQVNPFAQTAGPGATRAASPDYGPPPPPSVPLELATTSPGVGDPSKGPQVSPLAISNIDSKRGAFVDAMVASSRPTAGPDSMPTAGKRVPGTQIMPSMANAAGPAQAGPAQAGPAPPPLRPERTQILGVFPGTGAGPASAAPEFLPFAPTPGPGSIPQTAPLQPPASPSQHVPPVSAQPAPPHTGPGVPLPSLQGWNAAPSPAAPYPPAAGPGAYPASAYPPAYVPAPSTPGYPSSVPGHGYGFPPGARVTVTWSNGQRYPGTVTQTNGNQCLVAFPDGQQHWVETQYLSPG